MIAIVFVIISIIIIMKITIYNCLHHQDHYLQNYIKNLLHHQEHPLHRHYLHRTENLHSTTLPTILRLSKDSRIAFDPEALWQADAECVRHLHGVDTVAEMNVVGRVDLEGDVHLRTVVKSQEVIL